MRLAALAPPGRPAFRPAPEEADLGLLASARPALLPSPSDRGRIVPWLGADLGILDDAIRRIIARGWLSHLAGPVAGQFLGVRA
jgi:hypothetical protein